MRGPQIIALILMAYAVVVATYVEIHNSSEPGGVLQNWHAGQQELGDGGSGEGKMRGDSGFQTLLLVFGSPVYLASAVASVILIYQASNAKTKKSKFILFMGAIICLVVLARFMWLGVFSAGMGIG